MKKNKTTLLVYCIVFAIIFFPDSIFSQYTIKGKLIDGDNPIPNATLFLKNDNPGKVPEMAVSDSLGGFQFTVLNKGNYVLYTAAMSYIPDTLQFIVDSAIKDVIIKLKKTTNTLRDITITNQKKIFEKKIDRLVFNYANSNIIISNNAWDVLKITPMVNTTEQGGIRITGVNLAVVYINDRKVNLIGDALINYLKGIPEQTIDKIEVITIPSSKYDADGNAGIINIILKKASVDGLQIDLSGSSKQATYNTQSLNANLLYKKKKIELYSSIGVSKQKLYFDETNKSLFKNNLIVNTNTNFIDRKVSPSSIYTGKFGVSYNLAKKQQLDLIFDISGSDLERQTASTSFFETGDFLDSTSTTHILNKESTNFRNIAANYEIKLDTLRNEKLSVRLLNSGQTKRNMEIPKQYGQMRSILMIILITLSLRIYTTLRDK